MGNKVWVPTPASKLYADRQGNTPETIRERFERQYGEATVTRAELSTVLDVMMMTGMIKPSEFIEVISRKLARIEAMRQDAAGKPT